jgi:SulP family sulfate permease
MPHCGFIACGERQRRPRRAFCPTFKKKPVITDRRIFYFYCKHLMKTIIPAPSQIPELARQNWKPGLTVAFISVPLSIALSIASGAGPIAGLITGVWATAIAALFCGSNYNIIGSAGALTTVLFSATLAFTLGPAILPLLAMVSGLIILAIWAAGADRLLYYIPSSVMYGFATGVAFAIAASQLFDATGLSTLKRTGSFLGDIGLYAAHAAQTNMPSVIVFAAFLSGMLLIKKFVPKIPAIIPVALAGIGFGYTQNLFFPGLELMTLGEKFGNISGALFAVNAWGGVPALLSSRETVLLLLKTGGVIALISVLETLITAKIGDKITRTQSSSRRELLGLALANIGSGAMGGLPATGVFIRTGANIKAGATHRMSALIAAGATALIALLALPFFSYVPMAVIAAMLANTAIGLIEPDKFVEFWHHERSSFWIAALVAVITVLEDAGTGVVVGATLALILFADRVSRGRFDVTLNFADGHKEESRGAKVLHIPHDKEIAVATYSIAGFLGYIDSSRHAANLRHLARSKNVDAVIIRLRDLYTLDFEGQTMLAEAIEELHRSGKRVCVSSANESIRERLETEPALTSLLNGRVYQKTGDALLALRS